MWTVRRDTRIKITQPLQIQITFFAFSNGLKYVYHFTGEIRSWFKFHDISKCWTYIIFSSVVDDMVDVILCHHHHFSFFVTHNTNRDTVDLFELNESGDENGLVWTVGIPLSVQKRSICSLHSLCQNNYQRSCASVLAVNS